jgi:hypothetical protein
MNLNSSIKMTGSLSIKKFNSENELVYEVNVPNLIVTAGKQYIANRMTSNSASVMSHMGIGTTGDSVLLTQTQLVSQIARTSLISTTISGSNIVYIGTFPAGTSGSIAEAGIFNASTAGTMLCRTTFPPITKSVTDSISISWTVSVG